ncbi:hypothetical protein [Roseovarius atlanticus]|uniref:hypothetical protein n=1 Tax=Roseovarius atlanticus TaxID=1641875 RepID=UPI001C9576CB|nr:hypothetical protein [Roseovarius atlanticus]MBY5988228.1 hypothetical protein [Roseovarius atlanticus]MBY6123619.1 hypothetical protein [Roseovarius atlanticus]MBY6148114.1 hypothetical protein [Roseovarius atlanticus]
MSNVSLEELTKRALARDLDKVLLVDDFPHRCGLDMPLNPDIEGDREMLEAATLSVEDSGIAPLLWAIGLAHLKAARAQMEADNA